MTQTTRRHPIRGLLWGLPFGLGLALVAIGQGWAALGTWPPVLLFVAGVLLGAAWATFGPAKGGGGPRPVDDHQPPPAAPDSTPSAA